MSRPVSSRVLDAAIAWQLTLDDEPRAGQARAEFERWHAADEEHARAWHQLNLIDVRFNAAAGPARKALLAPRDGLRRQLRKLGGSSLAVLLAAGLALFFGARVLPIDYWLADQRTATGEQRLLQLEDGTRIELNTHSAVDIRFDAQRRLIVLRAGEILVQTGHRDGEARPLIVETVNGSLRPMGTRFLVRREARGTLLGVLQSAVAAKPRNIGSEQVVQQGQQLLMHDDQLDAVSALPPGSDAWTRGMLVVDNARLADLLDELARYRSGYLAARPEVADLRITGSFPLKDTDLALQALLPTLPVRIDQHTRWWTTVGAR
ncbi:FecR domain-containing protein [Pseudomonas sp. HR96]|uniref:FecR domain-containing protein n=1 Tax=Pseudomonas sp. HR96 TaxID=1027966 RepID=UPI002A75B17B|nr:FecR domain-containing protein [Pseudomonas sp. HR96]WPP00316.1 FecR domain-containing protein [Pseudomonas sp. HR96]